MNGSQESSLAFLPLFGLILSSCQVKKNLGVGVVIELSQTVLILKKNLVRLYLQTNKVKEN